MFGHTSIRWAPRPEPTLEEQAAEAVRLGREVAQGVHRSYVGADAAEHATARRCVRGLAEGRVADTRDEDDLKLLAAIIAGDLKGETRGEMGVVRGSYDPEGDDDRYVERVLLTTERGQRIEALSHKLARFRRARQVLLDRAAADRVLRRILSM